MSKKLIVLGIAAFAIFLISSAPASLITSQIERRSSIRFEGVSGTLWHGYAKRIITPAITLGPLTWTIHPSRLLLAEVYCSIILQTPTDEPGLSGTASMGATLLGSVFIKDADLSADAEWAAIQLTLPIAVAGTLDLKIDELLARKNELPRINAQLDWRNAAITYPEVYDLGAYLVELNHQPSDSPEKIIGQLKDIDSPLTMDGELLINANNTYSFDLTVNTEPDAPASLKNVLPLIPGKRSADGAVRITRQGTVDQLLNLL